MIWLHIHLPEIVWLVNIWYTCWQHSHCELINYLCDLLPASAALGECASERQTDTNYQQLRFLHLQRQNVGSFTRQSPTWLGPGASYFTETLCMFIISDFWTDL